MSDEAEELSWREKVEALLRVARYRPWFTAAIVVMGACVALLEGIGLSFIYPVIEVGQADGGEVEATDAIMSAFLWIYETAGIDFTLANLIVGIGAVMTFRFTSSFLVMWLQAILSREYEQELRDRAFDAALGAEVGYFDEEGSDDVLNAIITETRYSGKVIKNGVVSMETLFLAGMYLVVMFYVAPYLAVLAIVLLGGITVVLRRVVEPAVTVGTRVAEANQQVQQSVQAGTQGIRDVKLFGLAEEVYDDFRGAIRQYTESSIHLSRNEAALQNFYDLAAALTLFVLIYVGFRFTGLSFGALGIFLFAMFRLSPLVSRLNSQFYKLEGNVSHLVRTQGFLDELRGRQEDDGTRSVDEVEHVEFDDVRFAYDDEEQVLDGISFDVEKGEFVAFVGQSGAGKSTIVSLLARLYEHDDGEIRGDGVPIEEYDLEEWRDRLAVVRQQPFVFNDTLANNVKIGNGDATRSDVERVCEIAKVDQFADDLPEGYDSMLGDDGVRLSGGQRQRVAVARALLKDADFLVLDEATSDLDSNLEAEVQDAIESMDRDYGIIAIAHRLSTVQNADQIYTVDAGEIIEAGTHDELIHSDGEYAELYAIQSQG